MISPIQKDNAVKRVGDQVFHPRQPISQELAHTGRAECGEACIAFFDEWKRHRKRLPVAPGNDLLQVPVVIRLDQFHKSVAIEVAEIQVQRFREVNFVFRVASPVAGDDVEPAVTVEVACGNAVPPAGKLVEGRGSKARWWPRPLTGWVAESHRGVPGGEAALVISENPHRPPFTGEDKFRPPVGVEVCKNGAAHEADSGEDAAGLGIKPQPGAVVAEQGGRRRLGITPGKNPSADKEIEIAVAVEIRERERSGAGHSPEQVVIDGAVHDRKLPESRGVRFAILVIREPHEQHNFGRIRPPSEHGCEVALHGDIERWRPLWDEPAMAVVPEHPNATAAAGPDEQVVPSVTVEIEPGHAGAELAEFAGQERLPREVIERLVVVSVIQQRGDVGEKWRDL